MELRRLGALHLARDVTVARRSPGLIAWCAIGLLLLAVLLGFPARPGVPHDAFQYLSAAAQIRAGDVGTTSIVHFDAERSFGRVPAPLVTFPMGFPLVVAAVEALGAAPETAGALVSGAAFLVTIVLLWRLAACAGLVGRARDVVMLLTVASGSLFRSAATISTELLFTAVITGGFVLFLRARATPERLLPWALAGLAFGASYHVRYAGIFLVAGLGPVMAWQVLVARDRARSIGTIITGATAIAIVCIGFARNIALVGNWRGGNEKVVSHPISEVLVESIRAANGLVLGPGWGTITQSLLLRSLVFAVGLVGVVWVATRRSDESVGAPIAGSSVLLDLAIITAVYCAGIIYAALTSVISYGTRMFVPLIPVLALLSVWSARALATRRLRSVHQRRFSRGATLLLASIVVLNLTALGRPLVDRVTLVRAQLDAADSNGRRVRDVLTEALGADGILLANNGQAVGYALDRPTVSLVGPRYSGLTWDEAGLRAVAQQYDVAAVLITSPSSEQADEPDLIPTPFIRALANGEAPAWLRRLGRVGQLTIYVPSVLSLEP